MTADAMALHDGPGLQSGAAEMTQLNVRMSRKVKTDGDGALASIGFSPSAAVRALWAKAAKRGKDLEEVRAILSGAAHASERGDGSAPGVDRVAEERRAQVEAFNRGRTIVQDGLRAMGVLDVSSPLGLDDDQLMEMALMERMAMRGLS